MFSTVSPQNDEKEIQPRIQSFSADDLLSWQQAVLVSMFSGYERVILKKRLSMGKLGTISCAKFWSSPTITLIIWSSSAFCGR